MLEVAPGGTAPGGDEAQRVLSFFLSRCAVQPSPRFQRTYRARHTCKSAQSQCQGGALP